MTKDIAIKVDNLTKSFRIPLEAHSGIKQKIIDTLKGRKGYRDFTPLKDISFEIEKGDFFGIVGRNGSGKSTLLKTIAGIYNPNSGGIHINGTLVPFIELGVGFNPELTGKENVFLNGALLGFSHKQMQDMYDDIVDFAELHDFMEERLKNYSSGMQVRLAFSIAIRAESDILLLDEVLAVGDSAFQQKCYDYFDNLKKQGKTVVLVTHDMGAVQRFCNKALLISDGKIVKLGSPTDIALKYEKLNFSKQTKNPEKKQNLEKTLASVRIITDGKESRNIQYGESFVISTNIHTDKVKILGVLITMNGVEVFGTNTINRAELSDNESIQLNFPNPSLGKGHYKVVVGLFGKTRYDVIEFIEAADFTIFGQPDKQNGVEWQGMTFLEHTWK